MSLRRLAAWSLPLLALYLGACAHPITVTPNLAAISGSGQQKISKRVGLLISDADKQLQVTTPGGGGDDVTYFPYRDLEPALYVALSESFASVARIQAVTDPKVAAEQLELIVKPRLQTTSSSDSMLTWPPTLFTIDITAQVSDAKGVTVVELRVSGQGRATFSEFKGQPSLSANRAAEDAVKQLIQALSKAEALR